MKNEVIFITIGNLYDEGVNKILMAHM